MPGSGGVWLTQAKRPVRRLSRGSLEEWMLEGVLEGDRAQRPRRPGPGRAEQEVSCGQGLCFGGEAISEHCTVV